MQKMHNVIPPEAIHHAALSQYLPQPGDDVHETQPDPVNHPDHRADVGQQRRVDERRFVEDDPIDVQLERHRYVGGDRWRGAFRRRRVPGLWAMTRRWGRAGRRFAIRRRPAAVTPGIQGVLFPFPAFRAAVRLHPFVRLPRAMPLCAAEGAP